MVVRICLNGEMNEVGCGFKDGADVLERIGKMLGVVSAESEDGFEIEGKVADTTGTEEVASDSPCGAFEGVVAIGDTVAKSYMCPKALVGFIVTVATNQTHGAQTPAVDQGDDFRHDIPIETLRKCSHRLVLHRFG